MSSFEERFKLLRKKIGLTQKEMAKELEVPFTLISKYECGKIKPSVEMLIKLALKYRVNLNWLLLGKGNMFIEIESEKDYLQTPQKYPFSSEEDFLILEELSKSAIVKEFILKLIKAKKGDKEALSEIKEIIKGLLLIL